MEDNKIQRIEEVCDLINKSVIPKGKKLNKQQKIDFAYNYWTKNPEDLTELYDYLARNYTKQNEKLASVLGNFMNQQQITAVRRFSTSFYNGDLDRILNATAQIRENGNWLSLYDINREFDSTDKHKYPTIYSYLTNSGERFIIDKKAANNVLGMLMESNIPVAKCIVLAGFPYYAKDDMKTYVKSFQK